MEQSSKHKQKSHSRPPQHQDQQPGKEYKMKPLPKFINPNYKGSDKLKDKIAIITGGDSGIGRAVAIHFALEGANIVVNYLNEEKDAHDTKKLIEEKGSKCLLVPGDISDSSFCQTLIEKSLQQFKTIDILINNAAQQYPKDSITEITDEQLEHTFRTNIFSYFYLTRSAVPHLKKGGIIINSASITAYKGSAHLLDYSATKGAIVAFTRSLSQNLLDKGIRVNAVAPGPIWTPLIPSSFSAEHVEEFGQQVPMERAGEPAEIAPCYVFLASDDSKYMTGQVLHPNGGVIING